MFFILSKIIGFIIYPIHFILILTITYLLLIKIKILKTFSRFILILISIFLVFGGSNYFSSYFLPLLVSLALVSLLPLFLVLLKNKRHDIGAEKMLQ